MNIELKFRAWQDNEMLTQPMSGIYALKRFLGLLYEDAELMQYVGLKDKNGKEIYKADICVITESDGETHTQRKGYVNENIEDGGWHLINNSGKKETVFPINIYCKDKKGQKLEVIGNIYESPELLKL